MQEPMDAATLAAQLNDSSRSMAEAQTLLDAMASRAVSKDVALDVAQRLTGRRFRSKRDAIEALRRWRWSWTRGQAVAKAISEGL